MAKIEDLRKIQFDKIPDTYNNLAAGVKQLIQDYESETDKAFFEKEAKENIDAYFDMVKSVAPGAVAPEAVPSTVPSKSKKENNSDKEESKIKGKNRNILFNYHNALLNIAGNYDGEESDDLEGFFENVLSVLNDIIEDSKDNKIPALVQEAVKPFYTHAEMLEDNQKIRLGSINEMDVKYRNKAVKIVDKLLEDLKTGARQTGARQTKPVKKPSTKDTPKTKDTKNEMKLRSIISKAVQALNALAIDLEGEEEERLSTVRFELDDALDQPDDKVFIKRVQHAIDNFDKDDLQVEEKKIQKAVESEIEKIKDELAKIEKEKKDKNEKSKRVLAKVEEYEQNIAICRAAIREYNRKKKESEPEKPKPTRRTLLKKRVLSIIKLTPEAISSDTVVLAENRKIVKATIKAFMKNWGMTNTQQVESAIDKEFDEIEDKIEEKEQMDNVHRWNRDLPDTDKIIAHEKKHNKHLLEEAALQIVDHLTEAIKLYKTDKDKAFKYLLSNFENHQLEEYLPKYILEEIKEETKSKTK